MQKKLFLPVLFFLTLFLALFLFSNQKIFAQSEVDRYQDIQKKIAETEAKITDLKAQERDLSGQISLINSQINLTELKIEEAQATLDQLEKEIGVLGFRIDYITESVDTLERLLKERIVATYQQSFVSNLELLIASNDFSDLILRIQYIKHIQENDKKVLASLQETKSNYSNQKDEREVKQAQIEEVKKKLDSNVALLATQKKGKDAFLAVVKNDEARYQEELRRLQADAASISRALGSVGAVVGQVERGQRIASVGNSGCSTGPHLHFEVMTNAKVEDGRVVGRENKTNPKPYLDSGQFAKVLSNYSGRYYLDNPDKKSYPGDITTLFGESYFLGIHKGLDIADPFGYPILAADSGTAYLFSDTSPCYLTGTVGKGVVVDHENGYVTLYWHIP